MGERQAWAVTTTESVFSINELMMQRFRYKVRQTLKARDAAGPDVGSSRGAPGEQREMQTSQEIESAGLGD